MSGTQIRLGELLPDGQIMAAAGIVMETINLPRATPSAWMMLKVVRPLWTMPNTRRKRCSFCGSSNRAEMGLHSVISRSPVALLNGLCGPLLKDLPEKFRTTPALVDDVDGYREEHRGWIWKCCVEALKAFVSEKRRRCGNLITLWDPQAGSEKRH